MVAVIADTENWNRLQSGVQEARIVSVFDRFRRAGIEPVLIKGWAAARNYPQNHPRRPGDIDLAISPENFIAAQTLIKTAPIPALVDLHNGVRDLDTIPFNDALAHSILVDLNGSKVRILCPEDHLRVLCVHWLIDGGEYKDKLWDVYYAVENRPADFNWHRCLEVVEPRRKDWILCTISIAHKYFGLEVGDLPFRDQLRSVPRWIERRLQREWARNERLEPILTSTHDVGLLARQILRRIPPNPIRATIEANGDIYGNRRLWYQFVVLARRAGPFIRDTASFFRNKFRSPENQ